MGFGSFFRMYLRTVADIDGVFPWMHSSVGWFQSSWNRVRSIRNCRGSRRRIIGVFLSVQLHRGCFSMIPRATGLR